MSGSRSSKVKAQQPPGDLFALGAKTQSGQSAAVASASSSATAGSSSASSAAVSSDKKHQSASKLNATRYPSAASGSSSAPSAQNSSTKLAKRDNFLMTSASAGSTAPPLKKFKKDGAGDAFAATSDQWESNSLDCDADDFLANIQTCLRTNDARKASGFVAGALKRLSSSLRFRSEHPLLVQHLITLAVRPNAASTANLFATDQIVQLLCAIVRNENLPKPPKSSILTSNTSLNSNSVQLILFAVNLLLRSHQRLSAWPDTFVRLYVDDALGDRVWIDHDDCKLFVENILTAFKTRSPPKAYFQNEYGSLMPSSSGLSGALGASSSMGISSMSCGVTGIAGSALAALKNKSSSSSTLYSISNDKAFADLFQKAAPAADGEPSPSPVQDRFAHCTAAIEHMINEVVNDQMHKKTQTPDLMNRSFLKFLTATSGLSKVRALAVLRLEPWLHNPKLMQPAQELLAYCFCNCWHYGIKSAEDSETMGALVKLRLKTKALVGVYMNFFREMVSSNFDETRLELIIRQVLQSEAACARNLINMPILITVFQQFNRQHQQGTIVAETVLGLLLADFSRDEAQLRNLRPMIRELVRGLRYEVNLAEIVRAIFAAPLQIDFYAVLDLCCYLFMVFASNPHIRPSLAAASVPLGGTTSAMFSSNYVTSSLRKQFAAAHKELTSWILTGGPNGLLRRSGAASDQPPSLKAILRKLFFLEPSETYADLWQGEAEQRNQLIRLCTGELITLQQETIINVCKMAVQKEFPLTLGDGIDLLDTIVRRIAHAVSSSIVSTTDNSISNLANLNVLISVDDSQNAHVIELILALAEYRYPDNVTLPLQYEPPSFAITQLYWRCWSLILILVAHNPQTMGTIVLEKFPTIQTLIEMCITSNYTYTTSTEDQSTILQWNNIDKEKILELETHLAKNTITEQTSLLLKQIIVMRPHDKMYQSTPVGFFKQLEEMNHQYKLGHLLCRSRNPDFLLKIIISQQSEPMPWLIDLVHNSQLCHLPVQSLCEYVLFMNANGPQPVSVPSTVGPAKSPLGAQSALGASSAAGAGPPASSGHYDVTAPLTHLKAYVKNEDLLIESYDILEYLFRRLSNVLHKSRNQALQALKMILEDTGTNNDWLLKMIPQTLLKIYRDKNAVSLRKMILGSLRQACLVETDPSLLACYIRVMCDPQNYEVLDTTELGDFLVDMAQIIVERNSIVAAVVKSPGVVGQLIRVFLEYMRYVRGPQRDGFVWSESQDLVLVTWPTTGQACTIHIMIVQAEIILLTYHRYVSAHGREQEQSGDDLAPLMYDELLEIWFPTNEQLPKAYLVDTSEEALLIPDWLKLRIIQSDQLRMIEVCLVGLEASQLVLFIQSFGISVEAMTRLLEALDRMAVGQEADSILQAVHDKAYMLQLVRVQHMRGARGGSCFLRLLDPSFDVSMREDALLEYPFRLKISRKLPPQNETRVRNLRELEAVLMTDSSVPIDVDRFRVILRNLNLVKNNGSSADDRARFLGCLQTCRPRFSESHWLVLMRHIRTLLDKDFKQEWDAPNQPAPDVAMEVDAVNASEQKPETATRKPTDYALQIYRSNMSDLYKCAEQLLQQPCDPDHMRPEQVVRTLNFLQALIGNPRLMCGSRHGRNIKRYFEHLDEDLQDQQQQQQQQHHNQNLLKPLVRKSDSILWKLIDYVLIEAESASIPTTETESSRKLKEEQLIGILESRIPLLFNCLEPTSKKWFAVMDYLARKKPEPQPGAVVTMSLSHASRVFQTVLYMRLPKLCNPMVSVDPLIRSIARCELDRFCHRILMLFIANVTTAPRRNHHHHHNQHNQQSSSSSGSAPADFNYETVLKQIAQKHPVLFLRQLPIIATSLRGRAYLDFHVLKSGNHLVLFKRFVCLIELLQPFIFEQAYRNELGSIIKSFLDIKQKHDHIREISFATNKIIEILGNWKKFVGLKWNLFEFLEKTFRLQTIRLKKLLAEHPEPFEPFLVTKIISQLKNSKSAFGNSHSFNLNN